ncbi:MAG: Stress response protein nst1 [Pycnora praestabilis]|nr:MAG: Stress response protein nst1 [Pycnora praestabilis]
MTEEQRMEEGRRMFQIFAARMFEQRVLTAYREKVARERQQKLLEELEEESRLGVQREEKKAKEAQKKKDKKRLQKQVKEEEKAKRDAEKAAEEAIAKAAEQKKLEEQRLKKEEQRRKKEAERKAQEEEKHRKETEKQKRLQDERDRQAEAERKQREQKEREKRKREEARKKEREEREAKEKEARERKEQADRDRKDTEIKAKADKEAKDRAKKDEQISQSLSQTPIQTLKRPSQPGPVSLPPGLHPPFAPAGFPSPHLQVATPVLPKAPTPVRPRQPSQHDSLGSSPKTPQVASSVSQAPGPNNLGTQRSSPGQSNPPGKIPSQQPPLHHPQPSSPMPFPLNHPTNIHPPAGSGFPSMPPIGMNGPPSSQASAMPGIAQRGPLGNDITMFSHQPAPIGSQYRGFNPPNGMPHPSAMNGIRQMQGRGPFMEGSLSSSQQLPPMIGAPNISAQQVIQRDTMPTHSHSRHQSASFEKTSFENHTTAPQAQPIARPMPIQRPSSVAPQQRMDEKKRSSRSDIDDLSNHLGSSALLEDTDEPFTGNASSRRGSIAPGPPRSGRLGFVSSPLFADSTAAAKMDSFNLGGQAASVNTWGAPQMPFGAPGLSGNQTWSNAPGGGWPNNNAFGIIGAPNRSSVSRPVSIRLTICQACRQLTTITKNSNGFHDVNAVLSQVDQLRPTNEPRVQMREMLDICETEGDAHNGGGFFTIQNEGPNRTFVKYEVDGNLPVSGRVGGAPGEIGSPIPGNNMPTFGGPRPFQPSGGISPPTGF